MNQQKQRPHPGETGAWMDEPDIGSGEKTPGEHETDAIVRSVPSNRPPAPGQAGPRQAEPRQAEPRQAEPRQEREPRA